MMSLLPALPAPVSCWLTNGRVMLLGSTGHPHDADDDNDDDNDDNDDDDDDDDDVQAFF